MIRLLTQAGSFQMAAAALAAAISWGTTAPVQARIDRFEILKTEPAFEGRSFDGAGEFERIIARAHGSLDPSDRANSLIQDIDLAPRNAQGRVEYVTDVEIVRPRDAAKSNGVLLFNITNRGNKGTLQGSFIPFAATRAERVAAGDPRPSLEERYPDRASYVAAIQKAAGDLVAKRHLLATDAARLITEAERDGWSNRP